MSQRDPTDFPIDPATTSGTELSDLLNRSASSWDTSNSGATRPTYLLAGGIWLKVDVTPHEFYMWDGTDDNLLATINFTTGEVNFVSESGSTALADHVAAADPHPQYLTPSELPSTVVSWLTDNVSSVDPTFLASFQDRPTDPESSIQVTATSSGVPFLLGKFLRESVFTTSFSWYETNVTFQLDLEYSNNNGELWAVIGIRKADTSLVELVTTDRIQLDNNRQTYTLPAMIIGPFNVDVGDTTYIELWIERGSGGNETVTLYMEGNNVSRVVTATPIATYPAAHASSHEVGGSDLIDHDNLTNAQGFKSHSQIDTELATAVKWKNLWTQQEYEASDMVRDGDWTMIANKTTSDRPAPQPTGEPAYAFQGVMNEVISSSASQLIFGARYNFAQNIFISGYRVYVVAGFTYKVYIVNNPTIDPIIREIATFKATSTGWRDLALTPVLVPNGELMDLVVLTNKPDDTPTTFSGDWDYQTPNQITIPAAGEIIQRSNSAGTMRVSKTDNAAGDRSAELSTLTIGSFITSGLVRYSIQSVVDGGTYYEYGVFPDTLSDEGIQEFTFETITPVPITYGEDLDYYAAAPNISGLYILDGKYEDIVPDNNAYGIDILYQEAQVSPDWDVVAKSGGSGGGGGGGGVTELSQLSDVDDALAPTAGQTLVYDTVSSTFKAGSVLQRNIKEFTNVAGQSVFNIEYDVGLLDVQYNGITLMSDDFTATNGTTVTLTDPVSNPDHNVRLVAWGKEPIVNYDIFSFGYNVNGQVSGDGTAVSPKATSTLMTSGPVKVYSGGNSTYLLTDSGDVYAWGRNTSGEIDGTGLTDSPRLTSALIRTGVTALAAGNGFVIMVLDSGDVIGFGTNTSGQLDPTGGTTSPVSTATTLYDGSTVKAVNVFAGSATSFILLENGDLLAFGANSRGQANGQGSTANPQILHTMATDVKQVSSGIEHTLILFNDGHVEGCGGNSWGQVRGDGTTNSTNSTLASMDTGVSSVATTATGSIFIMNNGDVKACGQNNVSQVRGDGATAGATTLEVIETGAIMAAAGNYHTLILLLNGDVKAFGDNAYGQADGSGSTTSPKLTSSVIDSGASKVYVAASFSFIAKEI